MGRIFAECRPSAANETDSPRRRGDAEKAKSKPQRTRRSTKEVVIARIRKTLPLMNSGTDFRRTGKAFTATGAKVATARKSGKGIVPLHKIEQPTMLFHPRKLSWTDLSAQSMQKSAVTVSFWDWLA